MKYVRLKLGSDWGTRFLARYPLGGAFRTSRGVDAHLRWKVGERVPVRWPDGTETVEVVSSRKMDTSYSDMGRVSRESCDVPCIRWSRRGAKIVTDLWNVEVGADWYEQRKGPGDVAKGSRS